MHIIYRGSVTAVPVRMGGRLCVMLGVGRDVIRLRLVDVFLYGSFLLWEWVGGRNGLDGEVCELVHARWILCVSYMAWAIRWVALERFLY